MPYSVAVLDIDIHSDSVRAVVRTDFLLKLRVFNLFNLDSKKTFNYALAGNEITTCAGRYGVSPLGGVADKTTKRRKSALPAETIYGAT